MPLRFWRAILLSYAREVYRTIKRRGLLNGIASNLFRRHLRMCFAFFATDASLLFYELGQTMGVPDLATIFSLVCDVAMVAFLITVVRLYVKLVGSKDPKAKFKSSNVRVTVFVLVQCVLLSLMAVAF